jgi:hypothetical protein
MLKGMINLVSFVLAAAIGLYMVYAGVQHNTMQVFCVNSVSNDCEFDYLYAFFVFAQWFIPLFIIFFLVFLVVSWVRKSLLNL